MSYRKDVNDFRREANWTFWKLLPLVLLVLVVLFSLGFLLNSAGLFGKTIVERKVFENSYQRKESIKSQIATDEANLVEIKAKLENPNLDPNTRYNLEAQAAAARMRIRAAKEK